MVQGQGLHAYLWLSRIGVVRMPFEERLQLNESWARLVQVARRRQDAAVIIGDWPQPSPCRTRRKPWRRPAFMASLVWWPWLSLVSRGVTTPICPIAVQRAFPRPRPCPATSNKPTSSAAGCGSMILSLSGPGSLPQHSTSVMVRDALQPNAARSPSCFAMWSIQLRFRDGGAYDTIQGSPKRPIARHAKRRQDARADLLACYWV